MRTHGMFEPTVKSTGRNPLVPDVIGIDDCLHQSVEAFTSKTRYSHQWYATELGEFFLRLLAQLADRSRRLVLEIPFVDCNDNRPAFLLPHIRNEVVVSFE